MCAASLLSGVSEAHLPVICWLAPRDWPPAAVSLKIHIISTWRGRSRRCMSREEVGRGGRAAAVAAGTVARPISRSAPWPSAEPSRPMVHSRALRWRPRQVRCTVGGIGPLTRQGTKSEFWKWIIPRHQLGGKKRPFHNIITIIWPKLC